MSYNKAVGSKKGGRSGLEVAELLVRHIGEFKFRHVAQELDQRPQQRPGKDMVSQTLGSREKRFSLL